MAWNRCSDLVGGHHKTPVLGAQPRLEAPAWIKLLGEGEGEGETTRDVQFPVTVSSAPDHTGPHGLAFTAPFRSRLVYYYYTRGTGTLKYISSCTCT